MSATSSLARRAAAILVLVLLGVAASHVSPNDTAQALEVAVGGFVTSAIGHLPEAGEELALGRFHFRVGRADRRRVHTFVVSVHAPD